MPGDEPLYPPELGVGLPAFKTGRLNSYMATLYGSDAPQTAAFRQQLEDCFASLPCPDREVLRPRLRSTDNDTFLSAQWELFLWWHLQDRGWAVEHDPDIEGLTPDFRITDPSGEVALLEVWTDTGMQVFKDISRDTNEISAQISKRIRTPYWLGIKWDSDPPPLRNVHVDGLIARIRQRLAQIEVKPEGHTEIAIDDHGVRMTLWVYMGSGDSARTERVGLQVGGTHGLGGLRSHWLAQLSKKARKYRKVANTPLGLVFCSESRWHADEDDLAELCYGTMQWALPGEGETETHPLPPRPDGLFTELGGDGGPRRRHVSALIYCRGSFTEVGVGVTMNVLHSPFAAHPLAPDWFDGVPQFLPHKGHPIWKDQETGPFVPGTLR